MRTGRPVAKIGLSAAVAGILGGYRQRPKTAQALALRARIALGCAAGLSNKAVAARERVTAETVGKWRGCFIERGLDEPRPGAPRTIDDAKVEGVIMRTPESPAARRHAMEHARHGAAQRHLDLECGAHLARLRPATASHPDVQAVAGSVVHRQSTRHGCTLP